MAVNRDPASRKKAPRERKIWRCRTCESFVEGRLTCQTCSARQAVAAKLERKRKGLPEPQDETDTFSSYHIDDRKAYLPTQDEIAESCRRIRDEGFLQHNGTWAPPWDASQRKLRREVTCPWELDRQPRDRGSEAPGRRSEGLEAEAGRNT